MTRFGIRVVEFTELSEIEGAWTSVDFEALLRRMDIEDVASLAGDELRQMCVLSLQDLEPAHAAALLLEQRLGDALSKGQIQNISNEMLDEKLWEEYADMPLHERLFHVGSLLHEAFPQLVPFPDAVELRIELTAQDPEGRRLLAGPLHESLVVRLLAHGMPDSSPLSRLFGDALEGALFPEAESIAWIVEGQPPDGDTRSLWIIGSGYWLDPLRGTKSYAAAATADPVRAG